MGTTSGGGRHAVGTSPARGPLFPVPRYPGFIWLLSFPLQRLPERFKSLLSAGFLPGNKPHPGGAERRKQSDGQRPNGAGSGAAASLPPAQPRPHPQPPGGGDLPILPWAHPSHPRQKGCAKIPHGAPTRGLPLAWHCSGRRTRKGTLVPRQGGGQQSLDPPSLFPQSLERFYPHHFNLKLFPKGCFFKK